MSVRDWLDERMSMGVKLGLENCTTLLSRLGDPHLDFPSIHVAGSNGKGSVCVQLSAAACASGLTTGLLTTFGDRRGENQNRRQTNLAQGVRQAARLRKGGCRN